MNGWEIEGNQWFWLWVLTYATACLIAARSFRQFCEENNLNASPFFCLLASPVLVAIAPLILIIHSAMFMLGWRPK